jgi:NTP pyrophosphatase (non-canonical NTP hydrolase)
MAHNLDSVCRSAMVQWGFPAQADILQEECGELIVALSHARRLRPESEKELLEETVDVYIMVRQIMNELDQDKVQSMIQHKLGRTVDLIREERVRKGQPKPAVLGN